MEDPTYLEDYFKITAEDVDAIEIAKDIALRLIVRTELTDEQRIGLANAIYALNKLPISTESIECEFGVDYEWGDDKARDREYVTFIINSCVFEIQTGGSTYHQSVGWDNISGPKWSIDLDGYGDRECDLSSLKPSINYLLELGAEVSVYDSTNNSPLFK